MNINTPQYWDKVWRGEGLKKQRRYVFFPKIVSLIPKASSVIDIGCGPGVLLKLIKGNVPKVSVTGLDFSKEAIRFLKMQKIKGITANLPEIPVKEHFDIAIATETLEHLDKDKETLKAMFGIADTVIISVPNNALPPEQEKEHVRTYTVEEVKRMVGEFAKEVRLWEIDRYIVCMGTNTDFPLKKQVLCAITNEGWLRVELTNDLIKMSHDDRYDLKIYYPNARPIDNNRNQIVKKFLDGTWDYLLMIDSDNPPMKNPLDLIVLDKDVIACPTPQWNDKDMKFPIYWVVMTETKKGFKEYKNKRGLQKVDAVGTGCILITRRVLEKVKAPFMRDWNADGTANIGLDFNFAKKSRELGFSVWAHFDYPCGHIKELNLLHILQFYKKG